MTKKTFKAAPKPAPLPDNAIDAFERGGPGHDNSQNAQKHISANAGSVVSGLAEPQEPLKRLSLNLPLSTHRRFKAACAASGTKMVQEVLELIERRTEELEAEAYPPRR